MKRHYCIIFLATLSLLTACGTASKVRKAKPVPVKVVPKDTLVIPSKPWETPQVEGVKQEMRAVWLTTIYGLDWPKTKANNASGIKAQQLELDHILDRLKEDGFNTIFLQVRQRGNVIYPSQYEPFSPDFTSSGNRPDYDPLDYAVKACHSRGLACHAWLVTFPLGSHKNFSKLSSHIKSSWTVKHDGEWYLNPGEPEAREYIADIAEEIVKKYPVDGIHMDYVRYPENAVKFNDKFTYNKYGQGEGLYQWRRDNITALFRTINEKVHAISPWVQISAATLGKLKYLPELKSSHGWTAFESVHQDPESWEKGDVIDFVVPMMYYKDQLFEPFLLDWQKSLKQAKVIAGLGAYRVDERSTVRWNVNDISCQMDYVKDCHMPGVCFFRDENIRSSRPEMRMMIRDRFKTKALALSLDRGKKYPPAKPINIVIQPGKDDLKITWATDSIHNKTPETYRIWGRITEKSGDSKSMLIADGVNEKQYTISKNITPHGGYIEIGVEAVNPLGFVAPCDKGAIYMNK